MRGEGVGIKRWARVCLLAVGSMVVLAVPAQASDLNVRIAADDAVVPVNAQTGYTLTVENTTPFDIPVGELVHQLPGHGIPFQPEPTYGEPQDKSDTDTMFGYLAGTTSGATTADPSVDQRWLTWDGPFVVPASGSISIHFGVHVSEAEAWFSAGATVRGADGHSVSATFKGAQIHVISDPSFQVATTGDKTHVAPGGVVRYTTTMQNTTDQDAHVSKLTAGVTSGLSYVHGSTQGLTSADPAIKGFKTLKQTWTGPFTIPAHSTRTLSYQFRFDPGFSGVASGVRFRAFFEPVFHGLSIAGTGPQWKVSVDESLADGFAALISYPPTVSHPKYHANRHTVTVDGSCPFRCSLYLWDATGSVVLASRELSVESATLEFPCKPLPQGQLYHYTGQIAWEEDGPERIDKGADLPCSPA
jgi:uncharacterized repeat protein (TIGR01451 family)